MRRLLIWLSVCPTPPPFQGSDIDTKWPSYLDQYGAWLQAAFPQAAPQLVNKAQSGSTSNIFDACAEAMVPKVKSGCPVRVQCCSAAAIEMAGTWTCMLLLVL